MTDRLTTWWFVIAGMWAVWIPTSIILVITNPQHYPFTHTQMPSWTPAIVLPLIFAIGGAAGYAVRRLA